MKKDVAAELETIIQEKCVKVCRYLLNAYRSDVRVNTFIPV